MNEKKPGAPANDRDLPVLDGPTAERLLHLARTVAQKDENVIVELVRIYERDAARYLSALDAALALSDIDTASREIHALKGASLSIGAARVSHILIGLEASVKAQRTTPGPLVDEIRRARPRLDTSVMDAVHALKALTGQPMS